MIEDRFSELEKKVLQLIEQNHALIKHVTILENERETLRSDVLDIQAKAEHECELLSCRNEELTIQLKKIMSRLESLGLY